MKSSWLKLIPTKPRYIPTLGCEGIEEEKQFARMAFGSEFRAGLRASFMK
ncbi:MAG: hypothetical protein ACP5N9_01225 [Candidatus Bilamarchaeum sp.]